MRPCVKWFQKLLVDGSVEQGQRNWRMHSPGYASRPTRLTLAVHTQTHAHTGCGRRTAQPLLVHRLGVSAQLTANQKPVGGAQEHKSSWFSHVAVRRSC